MVISHHSDEVYKFQLSQITEKFEGDDAELLQCSISELQTDKNCHKCSETWCWTDRVTDRNTLHTTKRMKANCTGHILRRNCLLNHVIEGKIEGKIKVRGR
jgi:hypothetical protein